MTNDPLAKMKNEQAAVRRGRLKIYLGMAAGVGKTYGMLVEGQDAKRRGLDVVIGYLEPHGRAETEALAEGLEQLPQLELAHRGINLREFDVDAALARQADLLLVDELAHTNQPGSRHAKRWQDIEELILAGQNVVTTVNIQHIESLRDVVAQITGVFVQETVADAFFEKADEIELVDVPPEQLHQRLREGKVYGQEKVDQALLGFFKRSNLLALRELALRHTAERVDEDLRKAREDQAQEDGWHASERILVSVAPNRMAYRVVRSAKRLAASLHADLLAVAVESSRQRGNSAENREHQENAMVLAEKLGAKTANLVGDDIVAEVIEYARKKNVSTILMGKPVRPRWKEILFGSVVDSMIRRSGDIDVLVITGTEVEGTPIFRRPTPRPSDWRGFAEAISAVIVCTGIGSLMMGALPLANIVMTYLVGVVLVSMRHGTRESLFCALGSICTFNYFFVPPRFTFAVSDVGYIFTFGVMLFVSLILSGLTARLKETSRLMSQRERTTAALYDLSRSLAESRKREEMVLLAARKTHEMLGRPTAILGKFDGAISVLSSSSTMFEHADNELAVASWVVDHARPAGASTETLAGAKGIYVPIIGSDEVLGAIGIELAPGTALDTARRNLLEAIANQLAGALERAQFAKASHLASLHAEKEQMRSDLLSGVSHDLRTPLASIEGSAAILASRESLSPKDRELAETIREQSEHMARLIQNLLDMTRVQGAVDLSLDWQNLEDLASNAIDRTQALFRHRVTLIAPPEPLVARVDGVLLEQVLVNLLENAARHAGDDPHVSVSVEATENHARIRVSDDGPGIREQDRDRIFERFQKGPSTGFGLGLAICKAAVEAHGGTISADSGAAGATFTISLPLEAENE